MFVGIIGEILKNTGRFTAGIFGIVTESISRENPGKISARMPGGILWETIEGIPEEIRIGIPKRVPASTSSVWDIYYFLITSKDEIWAFAYARRNRW